MIDWEMAEEPPMEVYPLAVGVDALVEDHGDDVEVTLDGPLVPHSLRGIAWRSVDAMTTALYESGAQVLYLAALEIRGATARKVEWCPCA